MKPVLVLDTNVLISAALSPASHSARLVDAALQGHVSLAMSDHLCEELESRLQRVKFRRWLSLDDVDTFIDALSVISTWFEDRPTTEIPRVCDDPDDDFLVALFQDAGAAILVSGDKAVLRIDYPGVDVRSPADAVRVLAFAHDWGDGFLEGADDMPLAQVAAEGNQGIFSAYFAFAAAVNEPNALDLLPLVVVPDEVEAFAAGLDWIRSQVSTRGVATRPHYASPEIAYLKLPPDPGVTLRVIGEVPLPEDTIFATMQRCPDIPDPPGTDFDHWRVFGIGGTVPPEHIRPRPSTKN